MIKTFPLVMSAALATGLVAQSNVVPGLNGRLTSISNFTVMGSNATHVGCAAQNDMCNPGSVVIPWYAANAGGQMAENHPKFGFLLVRLQNDRIVQISDRSFCKHAFTSVNGSGGCGACQDPGTGAVMGISCTDAYGVGNNGDRYWLGPAPEIDPWLGTWNHIGSFFDQGSPNVGAPGNSDGVRSNINISDGVTNRVTVKKTDLGLAGAQYFYQIHLLHQGEAVASRGDNLMTRGVTFTASGSTFVSFDSGSTALGSILTRWTGAQVTSGGNGNDDGRLFVAVKVTGPVAGLYHYEYAVHNVDNSRGAATFRVPVCSAATVSGISFRDIDDNSLNDWIASRQGHELVFTAPAGNPLDWNMVFNFGFDCSLPPMSAAVAFDEARVGPGQFSVSVNTQAPAVAATSVGTVTYVGSGCGAPAPILVASGLPTVPNGNFSLQVLATPGAGMLWAFSFGGTTQPLDHCVQYLDPASLGVHSFSVANGFGFGHLPLPIPSGVPPFTLHWQVGALQASGPVYGQFALTNGLIMQSTISPGSCQ